MVRDMNTVRSLRKDGDVLAPIQKALPPSVEGDKPDLTLTSQFQEQCYLIDNMLNFAKIGPTSPSTKHLQNVTPITGEVSSILNLLTTKGHLAAFFKIKPYQVAALVPKIKLYKQIFTSKTDFYLQEFIFHDFTSNESLENITKTGFGRGEGVGIKSVNYEFLGTDPVTARKNIQVSIDFHFQTLNNLLKPIPGASVSYLELFEAEVKRGSEGLYDDQRKRIPRTRRWIPKSQRFALTVGWAVPRGVDLGENSNFLKKAIEETNLSIFMDLVKHSINFNQDGTITLSCKYYGRVESALATPEMDVLRTKDDEIIISEDGEMVYKEVDKLDNQISRLEARIEESVEDLKKEKDKFGGGLFGGWGAVKERFGRDAVTGGSNVEGRSGMSVYQTEQLLEADRRELNELRAERVALIARQKVKKYKSLLTELQKVEQIYSFDLDHSEISEWQGGQEAKALAAKIRRALAIPDEREKIENSLKNPEDKARLSEKLKKAESAEPGRNINVSTEAGRKKIQSLINAANEADFVDENEQNFLEEVNAKTSIEAPLESGKVRVNFFFLGHLVDIAAKALNKGRGKENNPRILLGPLLYKKLNGELGKINLADVPISLNLFSIWFTNNIQRRDRAVYLFDNFIRDVMHDLVIPGLGIDCVAEAGSQGLDIELTPLYARAFGDDDPVPKKPQPGFGAVDLSALKHVKFNTHVNPEQAKLYKFYLFVHVTSYDPDHLSGLEERDNERGIYHFKLGADSGVLKEIDFKQIDDAFWEAALTMSESGEISKRNLVKGVYNADVRMVGSTFFVPGSLVYINPTMIGFGGSASIREMIKKTGLGGYFRVDKVESTLSRATFETNLACHWVSFGNEDGSKAPSKAYDESGKPLSKLPKLGDSPR